MLKILPTSSLGLQKKCNSFNTNCSNRDTFASAFILLSCGDRGNEGHMSPVEYLKRDLKRSAYKNSEWHQKRKTIPFKNPKRWNTIQK